tara:strand:+ start:4095 stop:4229 length:135 start_codon:yes stop_codon:yes gene_type:complete
MNTDTYGKSIWDLYVENFLDPLWDETESVSSGGYYVDPRLLRGL